jgi:hypothetical protein
MPRDGTTRRSSTRCFTTVLIAMQLGRAARARTSPLSWATRKSYKSWMVRASLPFMRFNLFCANRFTSFTEAPTLYPQMTLDQVLERSTADGRGRLDASGSGESSPDILKRQTNGSTDHSGSMRMSGRARHKPGKGKRSMQRKALPSVPLPSLQREKLTSVRLVYLTSHTGKYLAARPDGKVVVARRNFTSSGQPSAESKEWQTWDLECISKEGTPHLFSSDIGCINC